MDCRTGRSVSGRWYSLCICVLDKIETRKEKRMWNRNFNLLLTANFFLYTAVYMLFPVLHRWMVGEGGYTNLQAGGTIAIFGISLYIFGVFNNYLVDTFKRKAVCTRSILLLALVGLIYPYSPGIGTIVALRVLQGALFGVVLMSMGSTLVIDVTPTHCRNRANLTFTWSGVLGMLCGIWGGYSLGDFLSFQHELYLFAILCVIPILLVSMVEVCFRAPLDLPLMSFDRFLLFRTLLPGLNMMVVPFILGVVFSTIFDSFFYICAMAGFVVFLLLDRMFRSQADGRFLNVAGLVLMGVALLMLYLSDGRNSLWGAGFLLGLGMGLSLLQFLRMMIYLPQHCERGTGYHTYQLLWESGVMLGVVLGKYVEDSMKRQYLLALLVCMVGLLVYQVAIHRYFVRRMRNR